MTQGASRKILTYNLFGESTDFPDVVHCETIEARSTLHDWEFAPHRHARLHQILLVQEGGGTAVIEGGQHELGGGVLVNAPMGCVHGFSFFPGTHGIVVTLSAEILDQTLQPEEGLHEVLARPGVYRVGTALIETMNRMNTAFAGREFARAQVLRSLSGLLLGQVSGVIQRVDPEARSSGSGFLNRFQALIDLHYIEHWSVADYAREMAISPTHLSRLTRQATGRPASALIEDRMIREARRNLVYTNLPVSRIAYALGYDDPAYFSRVFSRATGLSPRSFRAKAAG